MQVPSFITDWVDGRIKVGVTAAINALLDREDAAVDELVARVGDAVAASIKADLATMTQALTAIPQAVFGLLIGPVKGIPQEVGSLEQGAVGSIQQSISGFQQQINQLAQLPQQITNLPAAVAQAIGSLFPHFLRHLASLPPHERDRLLAQAAQRAAQTPDELARRLLHEHDAGVPRDD